MSPLPRHSANSLHGQQHDNRATNHRQERPGSHGQGRHLRATSTAPNLIPLPPLTTPTHPPVPPASPPSQVAQTPRHNLPRDGAHRADRRPSLHDPAPLPVRLRRSSLQAADQPVRNPTPRLPGGAAAVHRRTVAVTKAQRSGGARRGRSARDERPRGGGVGVGRAVNGRARRRLGEPSVTQYPQDPTPRSRGGGRTARGTRGQQTWTQPGSSLRARQASFEGGPRHVT